MRSSSCAQTADAHVTVSTPSRSPVGSAWAATTSPTAVGPDALDLGQRRLRREPIGQRGDRVRQRLAGSRRLMPRTGVRRGDDAVLDAQAHDVVLVGAGHVGQVGRRHERLARAQALDQPLAAAGVELAHDVVEQQQRRSAALVLEHRALGQQQRQQAHALLALRAVGAQLAPVAQQRDVVAVRAVRR